MVAQLDPRTSARRSRRVGPHRRGDIDLDHTVRQMQRDVGELSVVHFAHRRRRQRRVVLFVDVSGSMGPYADLLLRFTHSAVRSAPRTTEVFTVGTRLWRITRELQTRDPDGALAAVKVKALDWSGGTRLGETLGQFLTGPAHACVRGAVVVLATDGGEPGRADSLGRQLDRLNRLAHALIWVNPLRDLSQTAIRTAASRSLAEHTKVEVPGDTYAGLVELVGLMGKY